MADGTPKVTDFGLVKFAVPMADISSSCCTLSVSALDQHLLQLANENRSLLPTDESIRNPQQLVANLIDTCALRTGLSTRNFNFENIHQFVTESRVNSDGAIPIDLDGLTHDGSVMGSPSFMALEQAKAQLDLIGPHTDVYGLGATLYTVLTNQPPIKGLSFLVILLRVVTDEPTSPCKIDNGISEDLSRVVLRALRKQPSERYADMTIFSEDLERVLNGRRPLACLQRDALEHSGDNPKPSWTSAVTSMFKR